MSLPESPNRTYASNQRVARADIVWMEDVIASVYNRRRRFSTVQRISAYSSHAARQDWPGLDPIFWTPRLPVRSRILSITASIRRGAGGTLTLSLRRSLTSAPGMALVDTVSGGTAATWTLLTLSFATAHVVAPGYLYAIRLDRGDTTDNLAGLEVAYDIP